MRKAIISTIVLGLVLAGASAQAGVITFQYSSAYTGSTPSSPAPWLTATLTDVANGVEVRLQANGLAEGVFVSNWLFNLDSGLAPQASVEWLSGVHGDGTIDVDKLGGAAGNKFDLEFAFATSNGSGSSRFGGSSSATFLVRWVGPPDSTPPLAPVSLLSSVSPLTVESFLFTTPKGGMTTGAHIQGLPGQPGSGWVGPSLPGDNPVPEPGTLLLVGSGLLGLARLGRRRRP